VLKMGALTKKHFDRVAQIISKFPPKTRNQLVTEFGVWFAMENPYFDWSRFQAAVEKYAEMVTGSHNPRKRIRRKRVKR
jgi:hypothetical protein